MGMIIRVAFNNQRWRGRCKGVDPVAHPDKFFKCRQKVVDTGFRPDANGNCTASCWESTLCADYFWQNVRGKFSQKKAEGDVFFVFPDTDNSLVLWGKSEVDRVVDEEKKIYFKDFKAMPSRKWVRGLTAKRILGAGVRWGRNTFRYLTPAQEDRLNDLIRL